MNTRPGLQRLSAGKHQALRGLHRLDDAALVRIYIDHVAAREP